MLYGLPNSSVQDFGPFYAVLLQRAAFQEWKIDAPGIARVGEVTVVNAGDVAKEFGLIPTRRANRLRRRYGSSQIALFEPGSADSLASPFPSLVMLAPSKPRFSGSSPTRGAATSSAAALRLPRRAVNGRASN